jgi:diguanylate cyclase (GGDEF)-like protein
MKLQHKIIIMPVVVMLLIFIVSMISVEQHLKGLLEKRLKLELQTLSSFALSAVDLLYSDYELNKQGRSYDRLADRIGQASSTRITYLDLDGKVLGDSALTYAEVLKVENHGDRKEVASALLYGEGVAYRYSSTLKRDMVYFASFIAGENLVARAAIDTDVYYEAIVRLRWSFTLTILITIAATIIFGFIVIRLIQTAVQKERDQQESRIIARTREMTLIQTMSMLLNSANDIDDAARILSNIIPKLLPSLSGAIFLIDEGITKTKKLTSWGRHANSDVAIMDFNRWHKNFCKNKLSSGNAVDAQQENNNRKQGYSFCISLRHENSLLGALQFVDVEHHISDEHYDIANNLGRHISQALANIQLKNRLRHQAIRDPLTDLYNRRFMFEAFEQALNRAERHDQPIAVLMVDLDNFKQFNDEFGHEAGDQVLMMVSQQFKDNLRLEDIACRYGGEEFCIICPDINLKDAHQLAEKLREAIAIQEVNYQNSNLGRVTLSIGISMFPHHGKFTHKLIQQADKALYQAKDQGRNRTVMLAAQVS